MESKEPEPATMLLCKSKSGGGGGGGGGGNYGGGEIMRSGGCRRGRRFSEQQVRSLECMFEAQATLEPWRKAELARVLGLHPRQVAVWFQNRRARCKLKQLEREYRALRADYEALLSSFDSLKREKQSLATQAKKLAEMLEMPVEECRYGGECFKGEAEEEESGEPGWLSAKGRDLELMVCSAEEELVGKTQGPDLCVSEPLGSSVAPAGRRVCFDATGGFSDLCCPGSPCGWWEPWPLDE